MVSGSGTEDETLGIEGCESTLLVFLSSSILSTLGVTHGAAAVGGVEKELPAPLVSKSFLILAIHVSKVAS